MSTYKTLLICKKRRLYLFKCYLKQAEIAEYQILLALEPEAAALYCRELQKHMVTSAFEPGTKYMVLDMGGYEFIYL